MNKNHVFSILLLSLSSFSLLADQDDLLIQAGTLASNAAQSFTNNFLTIFKNGKTPDVIDPMGQYPMESEVALNVVQTATDLAKNISNNAIQAVQNYVGHSKKSDKIQALNNGPTILNSLGQNAALEAQDHSQTMSSEIKNGVVVGVNDFIKKLNPIEDLKASNTLESSIQNQAWYEKAWNAEIAGYKGAGKYVIVTTAVATALLTAYYLGFFDKTSVTLEQRVDDLISQAQADPNIVIIELPKILALCKNKKMKTYVQEYVLKNVVITPEIQEAFGLLKTI